jgi:hypothetical protein
MLKVSSVTSIFLVLFLVFSFVLHPMTYAETVFKEIDSESAARQIATKADGIYVKGTAAPTLSGAEVALPILDEASGEVLGHIVAEQIKLISVLNEVGMAEVASAIAALSVGTAAGTAAGTGFALGTVGTVAAVVAVGTGIALIVSSGGSNSTTSHP